MGTKTRATSNQIADAASLSHLINPKFAAPMQATIHTRRLSLRPFLASDAPIVQKLAGDIRVAETTAAIPYPYPDGAAEAWIAAHPALFESKSGVVYAITEKASGVLVGAISLLEISVQHRLAAMGYWVAFEHWSKGYCSEAATGIIEFAHRELGLTRIVARCLARNPASARVMEKAGLVREGLLPKHLKHKGVFEDILVYGLNLPGRSIQT